MEMPENKETNTEAGGIQSSEEAHHERGWSFGGVGAVVHLKGKE
jgi:hypothetical protein